MPDLNIVLGGDSYSQLEAFFKDQANIGNLQIIAQLKLPWLVESGKLSQEEYEQLLRLALENINSQIPLHEQGRIYVDELTKQTYEIHQKVLRLEKLIRDENFWIDSERITFAEQDRTIGWNVILSAGTVVATGILNTAIVSTRTMMILRVLGIPYKEVA